MQKFGRFSLLKDATRIAQQKIYFRYLILISDPPKILRVTPTGGATIGVHNRSILTCSAEGNPLPKYQWLQKLPTQQVTTYFRFSIDIFWDLTNKSIC